MIGDTPRVAVIGAGLGGLAAASALRRIGLDPQIYEQTSRFSRVGAGINVSPNAVTALRGLGLEERLLSLAHQPPSWINRRWDTGDEILEIPLGADAEGKYGARFLQMHRADLHGALADVVPADSVHLGKRLVGLEATPLQVALDFADGTRAEADLVVAADGVHSRVREILVGDQPLDFTGRIAFRGVIPASDLRGLDIAPFTKWWGTDRHIVCYYISPARDVYYVTSVPQDNWRLESWSARGDVAELRELFSGFHPEVRAVLDRAGETFKWALYDRKPLERWHDGPVTLLGDACHPMTPYLAQGAAMAIEDAVVLARCLESADADPDAALRRFQDARWQRTSQVQAESRTNRFGFEHGDPVWLYQYDAWEIPLPPSGRTPLTHADEGGR